MVAIEEAYEYVKSCLTDKRYIHTLGVISVAKKLAAMNGVSEEKAEIAALCHDIAKYVPEEEAVKIIEENNIQLTQGERATKELWHSIIGPIVAKEKLGVCDTEILDAIRYHTTAKENMSKLEKIIYIADVIEPSRIFKGVDIIREASLESLDKGLLAALDYSIEYLLSKGSYIDLNSIKARNYLILSK